MTEIKHQISIVLPTYRPKIPWIRRAVASIANQTIMNNHEVLISLFVCLNEQDEIEKRKQRTILDRSNLDEFVHTKIIETDISGIVSGLNKGVKYADSINSMLVGSYNRNTRNWIARIDDDDEWLPEKLENQIKFLDENQDVKVLGTQMNLVLPDNNFTPTGKTNYPTSHEDMEKWLSFGQNPIGHPSVMFETSITQAVGLYDNMFPMAEDMWMWAKCSLCGIKMANLNKVLVNYTSVHNPKYDPKVPVRVAKVYNLIKNQD
jgi:glycosyltransferase involved in cell wall biosynthesis